MCNHPLDLTPEHSHPQTGAARARRLGVLVALAVVTPAGFGVSPAAAADQEVQVVDTAFELPGVAVTPGEKVTWIKGTTADHHNVHFEDNSSGQPGEPKTEPFQVERQFPTQGNFRYYCDEHGSPGGGGMAGIVYVNASGTLPGSSPMASFTATPSDARVGETVVFDAAATSDSDGDSIIRHEWDLDGNGFYETDTGSFPTTSRDYPTAGVRSVKLRVTDISMRTHETTQSVTVTSPPPTTSEPAPSNPPPTTSEPAPPEAPAAPVDSLSREVRILSSKRVGRILRRGLRFEAAAPVNGATLRATLSVGGRALGSVRRPGLSRGRVKVAMKLSRRGKTRLKRLLAAKPRAKALLKVAAGGEANRARFTIRR